MKLSVRFLLLFATAALSHAHAAVSRPPNIVYILADDLGWTDLRCQGSQYYETPNIDRLASQGLRMQRFYTSQNCTPARAALMSGQYAPRTGIYTVQSLDRGPLLERRMKVPRNETKLGLDKFILPQALKAAGYATAIFGKWGLGNDGKYHPGARGFDEAMVASTRGAFLRLPSVPQPSEGYLMEDFLTDRAVDFIARHKDRPFFLYLPFFAVHTPIAPKPDYEAAWKKKAPKGTHWDPAYAAMIQSLDDSVGRVMARLEELHLADNTVLIFSSDNGGVGGYQRTEPPSEVKGYTDNAPLRGGKGTLYEGGLRVPFIIRWPGVVPPATTSEALAAHVDLYPTFLAIAGAIPKPGYPLDGFSFVSLLRNPAASYDRPPIMWHFPGYLPSYVHRETGLRTGPVGAIHDGDFKLLEFFETGRVELYNISNDLGETRNLADQLPDKVKTLQAELAAWRSSVHAPMPTMKTEKELEADRIAAAQRPEKTGKRADEDP